MVFYRVVCLLFMALVLTRWWFWDPQMLIEEVRATRRSGKLSIDYVGISLIALGFGALEIVLDKGQREDWLESHFIVTFLTVAILSLVFAGIWEWRHPDPVVEIKLFKEPNFALSNIFYFLFGFGIFGSTVLIPQMLQALFGYSATDAGLVLGPGAF